MYLGYDFPFFLFSFFFLLIIKVDATDALVSFIEKAFSPFSLFGLFISFALVDWNTIFWLMASSARSEIEEEENKRNGRQKVPNS